MGSLVSKAQVEEVKRRLELLTAEQEVAFGLNGDLSLMGADPAKEHSWHPPYF
ncbi:MAG: hypothetical protein R2784_07320 [Saprospiraceae bacterium]